MTQPMICCFTGHRKLQFDCAGTLGERLKNTVERLIEEGVTVFRAGGAMGFDTLAALEVLKQKQRHEGVRLELMLPCRDQEAFWDEKDRQIYRYILERADAVNYVADRYFQGCMQARNRRLVDGSHYCVAFCGTQSGGSAYTVSYAQKKQVKVINLFL